MKFRYEYRTSDNIRHSDVICAKSREGVFSALAKKGIKPGHVELIPDPWRFVRLTGIAFIFLIVFSFLSFIAVCKYREYREGNLIAVSETRKQLYGNPVLIESCVSSDWEEAFESSDDRYLARYAQPGSIVRFCPTELERKSVAASLSVRKSIRYRESDIETIRQIKRIVVGIREEALAFIQSGGTADEYLNLLDLRQRREAELHSKIIAEFEEAQSKLPVEKLYDAWARQNRKLSSIGLQNIAMPTKLAEWQYEQGENFRRTPLDEADGNML